MKLTKITLLVMVLLLCAGILFAGGKKEVEPAAGNGEVAEMPYKGETIRFAVMADQFADYTKELAVDFQKKTGAEVKVDILGYTELYQKITQDYATNSNQFVLATVDIMWSGEFADKNFTMDLTPWINRDKAEIDYDDILPVMWAMGSWKDEQIAFPIAGYANSLIYRKDLFTDPAEKSAFKSKYGYELAPPETMEQLRDIAEFFTRPEENLYGLVANGARGPAVAQDWMEYMRGFGGQITDANGNVTVNSQACLDSLELFVDIFDKWAPAGAVAYWWDDRETAYRIGQAVMQSSWSIARAGYEDPSISKVVGKTGMAVTPRAKGSDAKFGVGGWGVGINADSSDREKEIAWEFIKYISGKEGQKKWMKNDGAPIRRSTLQDPDLNKEMPWLKYMLTMFENGDGDYRPRGPKSNEISSILGLRVNQAITHELSAKEALDKAAEEIKAVYE
jgi:multiple sugar transport system substrate-binding protein